MSLLRQRRDEADWALLETVWPGGIKRMCHVVDGKAWSCNMVLFNPIYLYIILLHNDLYIQIDILR